MNNNITTDKGSIWRKWDLHIHTPNTKLNDAYVQVEEEDIWKTFCDKIEQSDVAALGITDYFSFENYFKFTSEFNNHYPNSSKVFFPNIEFRLDIAVNKKAEEVNIHIIFSNEIEESQLSDFLTELKTNHTNSGNSRISCKNLNKDQFVSATINHHDLLNCLNEVFGKDKPYIILAAVNNAGLRPIGNSPRKLAITDEIDKICDAFFGGRQNVDYCLNVDRYETDELAKSKPVVCGCDAHSFEDVDNFLGKYVTKNNDSNGKIEVIKDITWIKADLTFEGLKQIIYEPTFRVYIGENEPRQPIRRVESIKFNFPPNTIIKRKNSTDQQDFCLKNLKTPVHLSDYFTCIIGGRGTGKSTIINLLAEKLNENTDFFNRSNLIINGANYNIEEDPNEYIEIIGTNEIEFVSQGKVEKLAEANELTKLIFNERIKDIESEFIKIESEYDDIIEKIDENIGFIKKLLAFSATKKDKLKEKNTIQKIIDSINDDRYKGITGQIKSLKNELNNIHNSQKKYSQLLEEIKGISQNYKLAETSNDIDTRIVDILSILTDIEEIKSTEEGVTISQRKFEAVDNRINEINTKLEGESQKLREFFQEKGTNEETIKDSQKATENLSKIIADIEEIESNSDKIKVAYKENSAIIDTLPNLNERNNTLINKNLDVINNKLKIKDENVLDINFTFEFDKESFKTNLFDEFYNIFNSYRISGTSDSRVKEVLYLVEPNEDLLGMKYDSFKEHLHNLLTENNYRKENNYVKIVIDIFNSSGNFLIYTNLIKKHLYNSSRYIKIKGYYGNRELESCSFGQKCTAVIVTLLMTGVKPLIIDEPEAHLDNKLVADYLVGLVKEKQFDRQIIFASHNSNFVINGDSALIHILEIPNNDVYTHKTSTTIENNYNREKLLKLEGGKEAFLNRENKYGI